MIDTDKELYFRVANVSLMGKKIFSHLIMTWYYLNCN